MIRHVSAFVLVLSVILITACGKNPSPTGPEIDPLVGTWYGKFVSSVSGETSENNLVLVVRAGGAGTTTCYYFYTIDYVSFLEQIYLEIEVDTNGNLTGFGNWLASIYTEPPLFFIDDAVIDGSLDSDSGTGSGTITVGYGLYAMVLNWTVTMDSK